MTFLYFVDLKLYTYSRELSFYNSFVILLPVVIQLDRLFLYFSLFQIEICLRGQMFSALYFRSAFEASREEFDSRAVLSLWVLMPIPQFELYVQ